MSAARARWRGPPGCSEAQSAHDNRRAGHTAPRDGHCPTLNTANRWVEIGERSCRIVIRRRLGLSQQPEGDPTRSVFEWYNIVTDSDLASAGRQFSG
jgi:hypothetical protein